MARRSNGTHLNIAQLERILDDRRSELDRLHKEHISLKKQLDSVERHITQLEGGMRGRGGRRARNARSLIETLEQVLQQAGKPMAVPDIVEAVKRTGYKSSSANFRGIVNQTLIKEKRFTAPRRGVYTLKGGPKPKS